jgi:hypothetical protein
MDVADAADLAHIALPAFTSAEPRIPTRLGPQCRPGLQFHALPRVRRTRREERAQFPQTILPRSKVSKIWPFVTTGSLLAVSIWVKLTNKATADGCPAHAGEKATSGKWSTAALRFARKSAMAPPPSGTKGTLLRGCSNTSPILFWVQ